MRCGDAVGGDGAGEWRRRPVDVELLRDERRAGGGLLRERDGIDGRVRQRQRDDEEHAAVGQRVMQRRHARA